MGRLRNLVQGGLQVAGPRIRPVGLGVAMVMGALWVIPAAVQAQGLDGAANIAAIAAEPESPPYAYQSRGMRDPFQPPVQVRASAARSEKDLPPLQRHQLGDFRLVGIVWSPTYRSARVATEDGIGYTIKVGARIGPNDGRVRRITRTAVIVEEFRTDVFGERKKFDTVLALRPEEVAP